MNKKNIFSLLITSVLSYTTIFAQNSEKISSLHFFLNKLSFAAWTSFFFVTRMMGALFVGNGMYCIQALILLTLVIVIEAYTMHKLIKVAYSRAVLRMGIINLIHHLISFFILILSDENILIIYKYLGIILLIGARMVVSYIIYSQMDPQANKILLRKAILITNSISFILTTIIILLTKFY
jgi:CDP-diglyceride synthetase